MRIKIKESVITIPNKLIKNMDQLDIETANAINTLLRKDERIISQKKQEIAKETCKIKISKTKEKIQNAVNLLRLQGKSINPYQIAKLSNKRIKRGLYQTKEWVKINADINGAANILVKYLKSNRLYKELLTLYTACYRCVNRPVRLRSVS